LCFDADAIIPVINARLRALSLRARIWALRGLAETNYDHLNALSIDQGALASPLLVFEGIESNMLEGLVRLLCLQIFAAERLRVILTSYYHYGGGDLAHTRDASGPLPPSRVSLPEMGPTNNQGFTPANPQGTSSTPHIYVPLR
jgi:hypothetical protein